MNKRSMAFLSSIVFLLSACSLNTINSMFDMGPTPDSVIAAETAAKVAALVKTMHEAPHTGLFGQTAEDARWQAADELGEMKAYSAIPDLTQALKDKNPNVRASAASSLALMADQASSAQAELTEALKDNFTGVEFYAALALYKMDAQGVDLIPTLKDLCGRPNLVLAVRAADVAIAITGAPKDYIPALMRGMADPDVSERVVSVMADEKQYREYLPVLVKGTTSGRAKVRSASVNLLGAGTYASPQVTEILRRMATSDESELVRLNATQSLVTGGQGKDVGIPAGTAEGTGNETIALLVTLLKGHDAGVRQTAAEALGDAKISTPQVLGALIDGLQDTDNDARIAAVHALGQLGKPAYAAEPALLASWHHYQDVVKPTGKASSADEQFARAVWYVLADMGEQAAGGPP